MTITINPKGRDQPTSRCRLMQQKRQRPHSKLGSARCTNRGLIPLHLLIYAARQMRTTFFVWMRRGQYTLPMKHNLAHSNQSNSMGKSNQLVCLAFYAKSSIGVQNTTNFYTMG